MMNTETYKHISQYQKELVLTPGIQSFFLIINLNDILHGSSRETHKF